MKKFEKYYVGHSYSQSKSQSQSLETHDQNLYFQTEHLRSQSLCNILGLSFTIAAGPRRRSHSQIRVRRDTYHILLSEIRDSPNLEGQISIFISLRNRVAQLYPQTLGSTATFP
jgi:hypothetical protein